MVRAGDLADGALSSSDQNMVRSFLEDSELAQHGGSSYGIIVNFIDLDLHKNITSSGEEVHHDHALKVVGSIKSQDGNVMKTDNVFFLETNSCDGFIGHRSAARLDRFIDAVEPMPSSFPTCIFK